jgi:CheY-like chemotaxis protein
VLICISVLTVLGVFGLVSVCRWCRQRRRRRERVLRERVAYMLWVMAMGPEGTRHPLAELGTSRPVGLPPAGRTISPPRPATLPDRSVDVLIAEDDPDVRLAVRGLLEGRGYTCAEAGDGREAVDVARERPPRIVLLDLMMPGVDGFTAAQQLRADPRTRGARIHCLTALDFPAARVAAREAGCEGFLTKPVDWDGLLAVVRTALHSAREPSEAALN